MDCIFCKIIAQEIPSSPIYEDEELIVIPDIHPQAPSHYLVIPKKHIPEFLEMPQELLSKIFSVTKKVIQDTHTIDYRLVNNGQGAAYIHHFHLHILGKIDVKRSL